MYVYLKCMFLVVVNLYYDQFNFKLIVNLDFSNPLHSQTMNNKFQALPKDFE